jgi:hypothetical protein
MNRGSAKGLTEYRQEGAIAIIAWLLEEYRQSKEKLFLKSTSMSSSLDC